MPSVVDGQASKSASAASVMGRAYLLLLSKATKLSIG
jgi:hypothetical protein